MEYNGEGIDPALPYHMIIYKDSRIVEDMALGIYPNSVYALYTCI